MKTPLKFSCLLAIVGAGFTLRLKIPVLGAYKKQGQKSPPPPPPTSFTMIVPILLLSKGNNLSLCMTGHIVMSFSLWRKSRDVTFPQIKRRSSPYLIKGCFVAAFLPSSKCTICLISCLQICRWSFLFLRDIPSDITAPIFARIEFLGMVETCHPVTLHSQVTIRIFLVFFSCRVKPLGWGHSQNKGPWMRG
jgi:hypothetical protein